MPSLVYTHGGGWSIGSPDSTDLITRKLALMSDYAVVSLDYRLAPEYPYPAGFEDCMTAYYWLRKNGKSIQIDPNFITSGGDSAGGNLAYAMALKARDDNSPLDGVLALCPLTDWEFEKYESSFNKGYNGLLYDYTFLSVVRSNYLQYNQYKDPYASPMYGDLKGVCPSMLIACGIDLLYDENLLFAKKLKESGCKVEIVDYPEMPHAFYYYLGLTKEENELYEKMSIFLKNLYSTNTNGA